MMRKIRRNKKGLSEVVGYVLLIVIALSLAVLVYSWIKSYIPKETVQCPDETTMIIKEYKCDNSNKIINITMQNKGLFNVEGIVIKTSNETEKEPSQGLRIVGSYDNTGIIYFKDDAGNLEPRAPGEYYNQEFGYQEYETIKKIQIIVFKTYKGKTLLCGETQTTQNIEGC